MDKIIKSLDISKTKIPKVGENRAFTIRGTKGASFILQVVNSSNQFYNFSTKVFATASHIPENNFKGTLQGNSFFGRIQFPVVSGAATYNVIVIANPSTSTIVNNKGGVINQSIGQVLDTVISFRLLSDTSSYATLPAATTSTAAPTKTGGAVVSISDTATNASTDAGGFGLILSRQPLETDLVFRNTQTVDGTISSATTVVLDSVVDLGVGTLVVSGTGLSGTPYIKAVDTIAKTITLSTAQSISNDVSLTFEARGPKAIYNAIGVTLSKVALEASTPTDSLVTKTVRTAPSASTTINLNGTYGIAGGDIVTYGGFGVNSSTANAVTSVTASSTAGSIVVERAQTLTVGTLLTFKGCNSKVDVDYKFEISKFGNTNRTINLLLDNFIRAGAAS
jgi:hypothetical protein